MARQAPSNAPRNYSSIDRYMAEVSRYPLLTREQELDCARELRQNNDVGAAHRLVVSNLRFVVKLAYEFRRYGLRLLDLVQEGNLGLMVAVKKFDPERGFRLITYAVWWIRAHMQNFVLRSWSLVRVGSSRVQRRLFFRLRAEHARAKRELGEQAVDITDADAMRDVAARLGVSYEDAADMSSRLSHRDGSLDAPIDATREVGPTLIDRLSSDSEAVDEEVIARQRRHSVRRAVATVLPSLNAKEELILERRLLSEAPQSLQELGDGLSISRERVRQLEVRVKDRIKHALAAQGLVAAAC